jgi:hypothetical protein
MIPDGTSLQIHTRDLTTKAYNKAINKALHEAIPRT